MVSSCINGSSIFNILSSCFTNSNIKFITIKLREKYISILNYHIYFCNIHCIHQVHSIFIQPISTCDIYFFTTRNGNCLL